MKKLIVALAVVCFVGGNVFAAKNSVTTNVLGMAIGAVNGIYEFEYGDKETVGVGVSMWGLTSGSWKFSSTSLGADYNIYKSGKKFEGFYVGPSVWLNMVSAEYKSLTLNNALQWVATIEKASGTFFMLGGNLGYKWLWDGGFTLGTGLGVGYTVGSMEVGGEKAPYGGFGLSRFALDIGYAW